MAPGPVATVQGLCYPPGPSRFRGRTTRPPRTPDPSDAALALAFENGATPPCAISCVSWVFLE